MNAVENCFESIARSFLNRRIKRSFIDCPVPIFYPEKRLILFWNAKAGCTFSIKWMFAQMGLLKKATEYHNWIHRYRNNVYYRSKLQRTGIKLFLREPDSFNAVKIVTDPFRRAVRSHIHACINGYEDTKISSFLQREINSTNRFSFREFSQYLANINVKKCDIHHKMQFSEFEQKRYLESFHIIRLEDSMKEIPRLERLLNLDEIDLLSLRKSDHHRPKYKTSEFMGDVVINEIFGIRQPTIPEYKQFYDDDIIEIISNVYREDFERYNYEVKLDLGK